MARSRNVPGAKPVGDSCSVPWLCEGVSGNLFWVCVGRSLQGTKNIGAGPGEWVIQMPQAQSLTSLSLNFISQETLAGSNRGESTWAICVLARPGVSGVMDPLERGKGWPLARTSLLWMKFWFHGGSETRQSGRVTRTGPACPSSCSPDIHPQVDTSLKQGASKHRCLAEAEPGSLAAIQVHPPATYLQLQVLLLSLSVEQKARGGVLCLRWEGARTETRAPSARGTGTGRRGEADPKPCNTHLLFFFPPQWNRWPGGKSSN